MACAVSGAYLGIEAIPIAWQEKLEKRDSIQQLALHLTDPAQKQTHGKQVSTTQPVERPPPEIKPAQG